MGERQTGTLITCAVILLLLGIGGAVVMWQQLDACLKRHEAQCGFALDDAAKILAKG
jgi:hypothetical protein